MPKNTFDIIILNGRPAAGKSEVIDYLKSVPINERIERFHIGGFEEIDDFPILWERFEDDDIFAKFGKERLISNDTFEYNGETMKGYTFKDPFFWNFLILRLSSDYAKLLRNDRYYHNTMTTLIEFSRGSEHGGFTQAYSFLDENILRRACTLYIKVSWEESLRKNRRRYNPDKPGSILEHALEDKKLEMMYKESDWDQFSQKHPDYLKVGKLQLPYAVLDNEPEITDKPKELGNALERLFAKLWKNNITR